MTSAIDLSAPSRRRRTATARLLLMKTLLIKTLLAAPLMVLGPLPGGAAGAALKSAGQGVTVFQRSVYTTIDLANCTRTRAGDRITYLCEGLPGYPVHVAEGDHRTFVAASTAPSRSRAAEQSLKSANTPFKSKSTRAPIEWRIIIRDGKRVPYATIVKYYTKSDDAEGQVFVVMKVAGAETCHVAHIDAAASPEAIVLARQIADEKARTFNCKDEPLITGPRGNSPM